MSILSELARVCNAGGIVILSTLNKGSLLRGLTRLLARIRRTLPLAVPVILRDPITIVRAAAELNLTVYEFGWVLSPSNTVLFNRSAASHVAPLATNFIAALRKD
jgi:hypothetical protein